MTKRIFSLSVVFLAVIGLFLPCQGQAQDLPDFLIITHSVQTYSDNGPTMTVTLNLDIQNTGTTDITEITLTLSPLLPNTPLSPRSETIEPEKITIASIAAGQSTTVAYTLTSNFIYSEAQILNIPIFWKVNYLDDTGQDAVDIIESTGATP